MVQQSRASTVGYWSDRGAEWELRTPDASGGLEGTWDFCAIVRWPGEVRALGLTVAVWAQVALRHPILFWRTRRIERHYEPISLDGCIPII